MNVLKDLQEEPKKVIFTVKATLELNPYSTDRDRFATAETTISEIRAFLKTRKAVNSLI